VFSYVQLDFYQAGSYIAPMITIDDITLSARGWSTKTGVPRATIEARIYAGWPPEQAVGLVPRPPRDYPATMKRSGLWRSTVIVMDTTEMLSQPEAARRLGCTTRSLQRRLKKYRILGRQSAVQISVLEELTKRWRKI